MKLTDAQRHYMLSYRIRYRLSALGARFQELINFGQTAQARRCVWQVRQLREQLAALNRQPEMNHALSLPSRRT
jgi:hypothetical protein